MDKALESTSAVSRDFVDRPKSLEDLRMRPNFVSPLAVTPETKLVDVLTTYSFEREEPCGLSNCKQWHYNGYLVVTSGGIETNIGHKCGKREFGVDFEHASAKQRREEDRQLTLGRAKELQSETPNVERKIVELANRRHGVRWLYTLREEVRAVIGRQGFDHLKWRAARGEYAVVRTKEVLVADGGNAQRGGRGSQSRPKFRYVNENLGTLALMDWTRWDFPGQLFGGLREQFRLFAELSPAGMDLRELKKRIKQLDGWELRIQEADAVLAQAVRFLTPDNLRLVDLAIQQLREVSAAKSLGEWAKSEEYAALLQGNFKEGQPLAG